MPDYKLMAQCIILMITPIIYRVLTIEWMGCYVSLPFKNSFYSRTKIASKSALSTDQKYTPSDNYRFRIILCTIVWIVVYFCTANFVYTWVCEQLELAAELFGCGFFVLGYTEWISDNGIDVSFAWNVVDLN